MYSRVLNLLKYHGLSLIVILVFGLIARIFIASVFTPWIAGDTAAYSLLAHTLGEGRFSEINGERLPGYPIFMLLVKGFQLVVNRSASTAVYYDFVAYSQMLLGLVSLVLVYFTGFWLSRNRLAACIGAIVTAVSLHIVEFDVIALTESLSLFLVVCVVTLLVWAVTRRLWSMKILLLLSFLIASAVFVRPNNGVLFPLALITFLISNRESGITESKWSFLFRKPFLTKLAALSGPFCFIILAWCTFNYYNNGLFTLSVLSGIFKTTKVGYFIELAPDEYAPLRDTYLREREKTSSQQSEVDLDGVMWRALPEFKKYLPEMIGVEKSQELSEQRQSALLFSKLGEMSDFLIAHHPILYFQNYFESWVRYWKPEIYFPTRGPNTNPHAPGTDNFTVIKDEKLADLALSVWIFQRPIVLALVFVFLITVPAVLFSVRRRILNLDPVFLIPVGAVVLNSLGSSAFARVDARVGVPYLPLVYMIAVIMIFQVVGVLKVRIRR